jgi:hypothetical protein
MQRCIAIVLGTMAELIDLHPGPRILFLKHRIGKSRKGFTRPTLRKPQWLRFVFSRGTVFAQGYEESNNTPEKMT